MSVSDVHMDEMDTTAPSTAHSHVLYNIGSKQKHCVFCIFLLFVVMLISVN